MEIVVGLVLLAALSLFAVVSERAEMRRAEIRVWSDDQERRLLSGRGEWPLE